MFEAISYRLQNAKTEADRMSAWAELLTYLEKNPTDTDAINLYDKYSKARFAGRDWSKEVVSGS